MTSWRHIVQQLPQCQASTILVINLTSSCSWHALNLLQSWDIPHDSEHTSVSPGLTSVKRQMYK